MSTSWQGEDWLGPVNYADRKVWFRSSTHHWCDDGGEPVDFHVPFFVRDGLVVNEIWYRAVSNPTAGPAVSAMPAASAIDPQEQGATPSTPSASAIDSKPPGFITSWSAEEKKAWVLATLTEEEMTRIKQVVPVCKGFFLSKQIDPETGKPRGRCRKGRSCEKAHVLPGSESEVQLRSKDIRGFRLPFVGMFGTREHSVMLYIRPPIGKAIELAWGTAAMERIANLSIKEDMTGRTVVIAYLQGMRPPSVAARDAAKSNAQKFKYNNRNGKLVQLSVSGANLGNRFVHGTDIKSASNILMTGQLLMGESKPHGIYGYSETQMEANPAIQKKANFYDLGAKAFFEGYGAQARIDMKLCQDFLHDIVPENMVGMLRDHQVIVNPLGVQVVEIRFDAVMLCHYLDEALENCGYGKAYHETLLELKKKYDKERDGVVRAKRSKCG